MGSVTKEFLRLILEEKPRLQLGGPHSGGP